MDYGNHVVHKDTSRRLTTRPAGVVVRPTTADVERGLHVHGGSIDEMVLVHWNPASNRVTGWEYTFELELWDGPT